MQTLIGIAVFASIAVGCVFVYFLPYFVASHRKHPSAGAIFVVDLFLGWTFLGWVAALAWSLTGIPAKADRNDGRVSYGQGRM